MGIFFGLFEFPVIAAFETYHLNERQAKAIEYLLQHERLTIQNYEALCPGVNLRSLQRDLKTMIEKELIAIGHICRLLFLSVTV